MKSIGINRKNEKPMIPNTSLTLRRLGNWGVLPTNPQVARSSRAGRAKSNQWPAIPLVVDSMRGKGSDSLEAKICIGGPDERG